MTFEVSSKKRSIGTSQQAAWFPRQLACFDTWVAEVQKILLCVIIKLYFIMIIMLGNFTLY